MTCYVYIMQSGRKKGAPIKIGVASNPESRLEDLQTGNPEAIVLITKIEMKNRVAAFSLESWLHKRFASARIGGEWFNANKCDLKRAFGVWNSITRMPINPKHVVKSARQRQLEIENANLRSELIGLRKKVKKLNRDMEEYLDSQISY